MLKLGSLRLDRDCGRNHGADGVHPENYLVTSNRSLG